MVKNPPANAGDIGDRAQSLGWEYPLEKEMATHPSILTWKKKIKNTGAGCHFLFQGIFPTQRLNSISWDSSTGRRILYH